MRKAAQQAIFPYINLEKDRFIIKVFVKIYPSRIQPLRRNIGRDCTHLYQLHHEYARTLSYIFLHRFLQTAASAAPKARFIRIHHYLFVSSSYFRLVEFSSCDFPFYDEVFG